MAVSPKLARTEEVRGSNPLPPLSDAAYDQAVGRITGAQLGTLLWRLTERERDILSARFGLDGLSLDRVRWIERRALAKLARAARASIGLQPKMRTNSSSSTVSRISEMVPRHR
jgi:hypothetical protein